MGKSMRVQKTLEFFAFRYALSVLGCSSLSVTSGKIDEMFGSFKVNVSIRLTKYFFHLLNRPDDLMQSSCPSKMNQGCFQLICEFRNL